MDLLFPFSEYWTFYAWFTALVLFLLALDLGVFHRNAHVVSFKEALTWSILWITLGLLFSVRLYYYTLSRFQSGELVQLPPGVAPEDRAWQVTLEYLTGFIVEKSLAIDNIFVFAVVFTFFSIPPKYQHRILFYGIIGALIFRGIFIALGSYLMQYETVVLFFGVVLILTGVKMFFTPDRGIDPEKNFVMRVLKKIFRVTSEIAGGKFFIKKDGLLYATPCFIALMFIEFSDIIFAVDSVPAIFAITKEPLLVFTSNMFAILGLRALYFLLAGVLDRFHLVKYGLATILIFVGSKMVWLNELWGGKFPIGISLGVIIGLLVTSVGLSVAIPKKVAS